MAGTNRSSEQVTGSRNNDNRQIMIASDVCRRLGMQNVKGNKMKEMQREEKQDSGKIKNLKNMDKCIEKWRVGKLIITEVRRGM